MILSMFSFQVSEIEFVIVCKSETVLGIAHVYFATFKWIWSQAFENFNIHNLTILLNLLVNIFFCEILLFCYCEPLKLCRHNVMVAMFYCSLAIKDN